MKLSRAGQAIVVVTALGGVVALVAVGRGWMDVEDMSLAQWTTVAVVTGLLLASYVWPLLLFRDGESEAFAFDETCFVVLALLVPPAAAILAFLIAALAVQAVKRRPLPKVTFNAGQALVAVGLGLLVTRGLSHPAVPMNLRDLGAGMAGAAIFFLVNGIAVTSILVATGSSWRACAIDGLGLRLGLSAQAILAGGLLVLCLQQGAWTFALVVPAVILFRGVIASQFKAKHDRARMQGLFEVTMAATRRLQFDDALDVLLGSARNLLRCPAAELTPSPPGGGDTAAEMEVDGVSQWLVVSGRRREEPFDDADRKLLGALAAVGKGALTNAALYRQVRYERQRLSSIALSIAEGVCAVDLDGTLTFVNPAAAEMVRLPNLGAVVDDPVSDSALRAPDFLLVPARDAIETGRVVREDDARFPSLEGGTIPVAYTASPVLDGGQPVGAVIAFRDITERKAFEDEMSNQALSDSLTGLANRRQLVERLEQALSRAAVDGKTHALIFVDVDRFKSINDSLGHVTGDELLVAIAKRMDEAVRSTDLLARFGGDEFVVLLEDVHGEGEAIAAAERICAAVKRPLILPDGYEIVASVSAGVALTEPGKNADDVLHDADVAMYEAKVKGMGGAVHVFDTKAMARRSTERVELEADLRKGIERGELDVFYQPMFSIDEERIVGAEALVRWRHPTRGLVAPNLFIPLAEESGLILPLGRFVLERAALQARSIRDRLGVALPMSVNLSPRQFQETGLVRVVNGILDHVGLPSSSITFEITESMLMDDLSRARDVVKRLSDLGVGIAIDDFGTGHSSLGYLKQFPIDEVKVDRLFVAGVAEHPVDTAIVRAVVQLAEAMRITAVAEGIETGEQLAGLKMLRCPVGQGFYFARPLPADEFDRLLDRGFQRAGVTSAGSRRPVIPQPALRAL